MNRILLSTIFAAMLLFTGCHKPYKDESPKPENIPHSCGCALQCNPVDTFNLSDSFSNRYVRDPFTIVETSMKNEFLKMTISYGGGCNEHEFKMVYNQYSTSPALNISLAHDAKGDKCNKAITKYLCFDLSYLKKNTGLAHGSIEFPVSDTNGKTVTVKYDY